MTRTTRHLILLNSSVIFLQTCGKTPEDTTPRSLVSLQVNWNAPHPEIDFQPQSYEISLRGCKKQNPTTASFSGSRLRTAILNLEEGDTGCVAAPSKVTYANSKGMVLEYTLKNTSVALSPGGVLTLEETRASTTEASPVSPSSAGAISVQVSLGAPLPSPLPSKTTLAFGIAPVKRMGAGEGILELGHFQDATPSTAGVPLVARRAEETDALEGNRAFFVTLSCQEALQDDLCSKKHLLDFRYAFRPAGKEWDDAFADASAQAAQGLFAHSAHVRRPTIAHYHGNGLRVLVEAESADDYVFAVQWTSAVRVFQFQAP